MKISIIISIYKRLDFLSLVFLGLRRQSYKDFEVILAEDDNDPLTKEFIVRQNPGLFFPVRHVSQKDAGFRKAAILNKAILAAQTNFIVFLDGDTIPHKHFIANYAKNIENNTMLYGRRVMLSEKITRQLIEGDSLNQLTLSNIIFSGSGKIKEGIYLPDFLRKKNKNRGIWGCNWGISRENLIKVNGFDENYKYAGIAEDEDIEWRLFKLGVKRRSLKHRAIVYHLFHPFNYTMEEVMTNRNMLTEKKNKGEVFCNNGIFKR